MAREEKRLLYLGDDTAYYKVLVAEFGRLYPSVKLEQFSEQTPQLIQSLVLKVQTLIPDLVFVDFSKHTDDYVHLARTLIRTNRLHPLFVVGLHDYLSPPEQIQESFLAGVHLNHIKSGEVFDVVFGAMNLVAPGQAKEHGFATGKFTQEVTSTHLCKIGFIQERGMHFETPISFGQTEELRIRHHWNQKKLIPSSLTRVKNKSKTLLFYSKYAYDIEFAWMDPLVKSDSDSQERIDELTNERDHAVNKAKKALESWLSDNTDRSQKKSVRVLIIDRHLNFYHNRPRTDKYGYAIRCQPFLENPTEELDAQRPQVVAYSLDVVNEGESPPEGPVNDMAGLKKLIQIFSQKLTDLKPYIIVFNSPQNSKQLQTAMNYPQIMAYTGEISPEVMLKMASMFEGKLKLEGDEPSMEAPSQQVFIKKSSPMSIGEIEQPITLIQISETDLAFTCDRELPVGATLKITQPFQGYVTVAHHPQLSKAPVYYALINGIGENDKKTLRRFVNTIFFKDLDAAKLAELENFQNLNQAKWQEMLDKQKAILEAEEMALKAAQEAAAENAAKTSEET